MRILLAGSGMATAYGPGLPALWDGLMSGRTAIGEIDWFDGRGFVSRMAGVVPGVPRDGDGEPRILRLLRPLLAPLRGALPPATPLLLATTVGAIEHVERAVLAGGPPDAARSDRLLAAVQASLGLTGPSMVVSAACASGALAVARAAAWVAAGRADAVLVVAADAVSEFVYSGFSSLLVLSEAPARPFDRDRDGLTVGEAAAWALVARADRPVAVPGTVDPPAAILGWGCANDACHMTAPAPDGDGLRRAMAQSLARHAVAPDQVDLVCAHGTGTLQNDAMEAEAFCRFLPAPVPVFSLKGGTGHTMGAAGLVELLATAAALRQGIVPPTVGLRIPEPGLAGWLAAAPVRTPEAALALSTNSGFGGINTAVLLGRVAP